MRQKDLSDAIGLEKVMTFEEWVRQECFKAPPEHSVELAKSAWDYQQQAIDALSLVWAKQQARIKALEAERDSLKDSMRRAMRKLPHVDRKILAERHGIKEADHE